MGVDFHLQQTELALEAKRIAEEEALKRAQMEADEREIAQLQETLRVKMEEKRKAEAATKAALAQGPNSGEDERHQDQDIHGEEEVIIDTTSDDDNDDKRRIPVSVCCHFLY